MSNINFTGTRALLVEVVLFMGALPAYFLKFLELVKHQLYRPARPTFGDCAISGRSSGMLSVPGTCQATRALLLEVVLFMGALLAYFLKFQKFGDP